MSLTFQVLDGAGIDAALDDLANLRIKVFAEWPYIYDGDLDYERRYMATYKDNPDAVIVAAIDGGRVVGCGSGSPMEAHQEGFREAFAGTGYDMADIYYCAESVLLPEYRGQGAGHAFFDGREGKARSLGRKYSAFCSVLRPDDHPLRPAGYRPLYDFWRARGYAPLDGVIAHFDWKDRGQETSSQKPLQFWIKTL